jgi:hypothetical protein
MRTILNSLAPGVLTASTVNVQTADAVTVDPKIAACAVTSRVSGKLTSRVPTP